jgi:glycosyltransferase involved in cell wall biosynthesis
MSITITQDAQAPSAAPASPGRPAPPLRIAHVTATFPPYRGGTGNVCFHNAHELARRGHAVHVFTAAVPDATAEDLVEGIHIHRLPALLRVGNAPVLPQLLRHLRAFDVIHLHYPFFGGEITALAARLERTPLVITYHQDVLLGGVLGAVEKVLRASIGRLTLYAAARVLFTSEDYSRASYVRPLLRRHAQQIYALPNGVDSTAFTPGSPSPALAARYRRTPEDRIVLLVAGLDQAHYFKGVHILLGALTRLPVHIKAVIVGDGDLRSMYESAAASLGLAGRVHFAGRIGDQQLRDYYRLADVTVLPSITMGEAFGLVLLESLASATPVIASNLPGVRTVVDQGVDGLLMPPGDPAALTAAIRQILANEPARQAMGWRGRAKVEAQYDWHRIGGRLEDLYRELLVDGRGARLAEQEAL